MRLIASIVERAVIVRILDHLGEPSEPARAGPIRDPPEMAQAWAEAGAEFDALAIELISDVMPDYENQRQDLGW